MGSSINSFAPSAVACSANDVSTPAANTAAVVTYPGVPGKCNTVSGVMWSYSGGDPVGGNLSVLDGSATVFSMNVTSQGAGFLPFTPNKRGTAGASMTVTLSAGGAGVTGTLSVTGQWVE